MSATVKSDSIPMVDLAAQYQVLGPKIEEAVLRVLRSGHYVLGPETAAFEEDLARFVGTEFAIGVGSGTEALVLALHALGIGPGDEVITTPFTFFATLEAIVWAGATPVFADIEPDRLHLDPAGLEKAFTPRTKAVLAVHLFGFCANIAGLRSVADSKNIPVIEDAAQGVGSQLAGVSVGAMGTMGCFSFYPSKNLGAAGDGGAVTTNDPALVAELHALRAHGLGLGDGHERIGTTSRLDSIQAAILRVKLPFLKTWNEARAQNARAYSAALEQCPDLILPTAQPGEIPIWNQYTIRSPKRAEIETALTQANIDCRRFYARPVYEEPSVKKILSSMPDCPNTEKACEEVLSLPMFPTLKKESIDRVTQVIREVLGKR